jgi:hypothetical protein
MTHNIGGAGFRLRWRSGRPTPAPPVRWPAFLVGMAMLLIACGSNAPTATPTATPAPTATRPATNATPTAPAATPAATATAPLLITAVPGSVTAAPTTPARGLPDRTPDKSAGARSDGWILDSVTTERAGGQATLVLAFQPLPGAAGGPQVDAWFQMDRATYILAVRGVRGSSVVLRPGEVTAINAGPLQGYTALPVRDDTLLALAISAAGPSSAWQLTSEAPGVVRLSVAEK